MKIIKLQAENIKNLKAVEITPDGKAVILTGKNGAGKSAILDAIFTALTGKKLDEPIRKGQDRAEVIVDLGDFIVKKVFTEKGARLEVTSKDGDIKKSPQTFLDEIFGKISFDPLAFSTMKPRDQLDLLKDVVGLKFDDIEARQTSVYDQRTVVNSQIKGVIAQLKEAKEPDPETPEDEVSFKDQIEVVNRLREKRNFFLNQVQEKDRIKDIARQAEEDSIEIKEEIGRLSTKLAELANVETNALADLEKFQLPLEVTEESIQSEQDKLSDLEDMNVSIRQAKRYNGLVRESNKLKEQSDKLTQQIERLEQDKSTRIANAKFPIEGLSISDDSVLFDGIPFSQLSTGQQIRVSTSIAMALNPRAKVLLIREGSLLDDAGLKALCEMAQEKGYQPIIEKVDDSGKVGIYIEDGSIRAIDGQEVKNEVEEKEPGEAEPVAK